MKWNKETLIAIVGLLAVVLGWSVEFQSEVINAVLVAIGSITMLVDTAKRAIAGE